MPRLPKNAKSETGKLYDTLGDCTAKKTLAFVVYSCYKMSSPPGSAGSF
jgi:hypothetical protein